MANMDSHSAAVPMVAPSACLSCSGRKQKCDKAYPVCSRCERLLLKCNYRAAAKPAPPSRPTKPQQTQQSQTIGSEGLLRDEVALEEDLMLAQNDRNYLSLSYLTKIIDKHKQSFNRMADNFLVSCPRWMPWMPAVHEDTCNEIFGDRSPTMSRGSILLLLAMCMLTRPLMSKYNQTPDALREYMYMIVKRLFWEPDTMGRPTTAVAKAGLLLSVYEYGQGISQASFMTISICASMTQVTLFGVGEHESLKLPPFGTDSIREDPLRLWWSIKIHERMTSLRTGLPIGPLPIDESSIMDNNGLERVLQTVLPHLATDPHHVAFHLQARSALWLDLVLRIVRVPSELVQANRLRFHAVDRGLLQFLTITLGLGLGSCCEAIAIALNAFVHLHRCRLNSDNYQIYTEQDRMESSRAICTILRVLSDFMEDHMAKNPNFSFIQGKINDSGMFTETFPYFVHMVYVLVLEMQEHRRVHSPSSSSSSQSSAWEETSDASDLVFEKEISALLLILRYSAQHWEMSREYLSELEGRAQ